MTKMLLPLIRDAGRFALFTLVFGPALLLYGIVIAISLEGSLAGLPVPGEEASPPSYLLPPLSICHRDPVDSERWTKPMDATLFNLWLIAALFGATLGFLTHLYIHRRASVHEGRDIFQKETHV